MIRRIAVWYLQRQLDFEHQPPKWVQRKLRKDVLLQQRWSELQMLDACLRSDIEWGPSDGPPLPSLASSWQPIAIAVSAVVAASVLYGLWMNQPAPVSTVPPGSQPVVSEGLSETDDQITTEFHHVKDLLGETRVVMLRIQDDLSDRVKTRTNEMQGRYQKRISTDGRRLLDSLTRLVVTLEIKEP